MDHHRHITSAVVTTLLLAACVPLPASSPIPGSSDATANPIPGGSGDFATALQSLFGSDIMAETTRADDRQAGFIELTEANWKAVVEESKLPVWVFFKWHAGDMEGQLYFAWKAYDNFKNSFTVATVTAKDQPALFDKHYEWDALILVYKLGKVVDRWYNDSRPPTATTLLMKYISPRVLSTHIAW